MRDQPTNEPAYHLHGAERPGRWLVTCDHASNRVPGWIGGGSLGIAPGDMARHIAYDVGAAGLAVALAGLLGAPAILSHFSRLVIDPNRGEDDPTLIMRLYDGTVIPANRRLTEDEAARRLNSLYRPYHAALAMIAGARADRAICAIHSFTPCLKGRPPRPWQVAVLHSHHDTRLAIPLIVRLRGMGLCCGDNQPYNGHLEGDSIARHALAVGRPNVLIEVRNDLIADADGQAEWAGILSHALKGLLEEAGV